MAINRYFVQTRTPGQYGQYGNVCFILVFSVSYYSQYEKPVRNTFREQRFRVRPLPVRKRPKPVRIVRNQYGKNKMKLFKTALGWLSPAGPWPVRTVRNQYETSTEIFGGSCKETNRAISLVGGGQILPDHSLQAAFTCNPACAYYGASTIGRVPNKTPGPAWIVR